MNIKLNTRGKAALLIAAMAILIFASTRMQADTGTCGGQSITLPFTDVQGNFFFCAIAEAYFSGLTSGTTPTTYNPSDPVTREQMAAFITRAQDSALKRGSRRAALNQWWTPQLLGSGMLTDVDGLVTDVVSDGVDLWSMGQDADRVDQVRGSDGAQVARLAAPATTAVVAAGRIYVAGGSTLSYIHQGAVATVSSAFSANLTCITFDGAYVWTGSSTGVIGKTSVADHSVTTANSGFGPLNGMLYDGANVWVTEASSGGQNGYLYRLDSSGATAQMVATGVDPRRPVFDGTNIWVPNFGSNTVTVVRASTGAVLATLSGNGLNGPTAAAFDGQRILMTNANGNSVSLWKAADLSPLGSVSLTFGLAYSPLGVCNDGVNFWVAATAPYPGLSKLIRF